jgi:hypothetical protein
MSAASALKSRKQANKRDLGGLDRMLPAGAPMAHSSTFYAPLPGPPTMADFTKEWIEHLKAQISGRMGIVKDKMDPQTYDELVTDLAWFTFRFARDPDTKMRKVFR